jgi:NitT/TauT family transport system permease protein
MAPRLGFLASQTLPPPSEVAVAWVTLLQSGDLLSNGVASLVVLCEGLFLSVVVGITLGVTMARYQVVEDIFGFPLKALYPVPKSALIPIMIIWFGLGSLSKVASVFLGCLLPIVTSTYYGAKGVERILIWTSESVGARPSAVLWGVIIPAAMPDILAGIRNAIAIGFILLVSSELLIGQTGMGYLISFSGEAGSYASMFAAILTVSAAGFIADRSFVILMMRALRWRE